MKWRKGITVAKDPDAVLDWAWEFVDWLESGDSLSSKTVTEETGITVDSSEISGTQVIVWLSGGTAGTSYDVMVRPATVDGRSDDFTVTFQVGDK